MSVERRDTFERDIVELLPELYAAALRFTRNETDAEDLVADAVAKAWKKRETLRDPASFRGWVFRILTNTYISAHRARDARPVHESFVESDDAASDFSLYERLHPPIMLWWGNPEREFVRGLLRADLERAIDSLPEVYRVVVVLCYVEGFKYAEIAEALDVPVGTVRSRLARARARMQEFLWNHAVDAGIVAPGSPKTTAPHE